MAQKVTVQLVDDLDGSEISEGGQTVQFGLDGKQYEIDLTDKHADALRKAMTKYVAASRKIGGRKSSTSKRSSAASSNGSNNGKVSPALIREWAAANNIEVSDRGRIPKEIREQYLAAV